MEIHVATALLNYVVLTDCPLHMTHLWFDSTADSSTNVSTTESTKNMIAVLRQNTPSGLQFVHTPVQRSTGKLLDRTLAIQWTAGCLVIHFVCYWYSSSPLLPECTAPCVMLWRVKGQKWVKAQHCIILC